MSAAISDDGSECPLLPDSLSLHEHKELGEGSSTAPVPALSPSLPLSPFQSIHAHTSFAILSLSSPLPSLSFLQNIHSTAQRAMRSGDGGTIADLSVSHHKSLQLMRQQSRQLEDIVRTAETRKAKITQHIHEVRH